jgi:hypothetical protein
MTTSSDDLDALFGTPASPPAPPAPAPPTHAPPAAEARRELRVKVSWPARVQLPNGRVVDLRVRDLAESGVGLVSEVSIPANTVLTFAVGVPGLADPTRITPVVGTIRTTYLVLQGRDLCCGGTWVNLPDDARDLLHKWVQKLRR